MISDEDLKVFTNPISAGPIVNEMAKELLKLREIVRNIKTILKILQDAP